MARRGSIQADVIVAGSGGTGVGAAIQARKAGARVVILESEGELGGATVISGGGCCMVGTPFQREYGIDDSAALAFADWVGMGQGAADEQWARFYIEHSCHDLFEWLTDMGVTWEAFHQQEGNSVPRWHLPTGGGKAIWHAMHRRALDAGVDEWMLNTPATELVVYEGRVVGVRAEDRNTGREVEISGKAVVMATGGYMSNVDMVKYYKPDLREHKILAGSSVGATGSGHKIVTEVGGLLTHMDDLWMYAYATPDYLDPEGQRGLVVRGLPDYVWVNAYGRRFHNESLSGGASATPAVLAQEPPFCWAVIDSVMQQEVDVSDPRYRDGSQRIVDRIAELFRESPYIKSASTLKELAGEAALPP